MTHYCQDEEAALPHIRKQIAADIRATLSGPLQPRASLPESFIDVGMERAATIAEEGPLE